MTIYHAVDAAISGVAFKGYTSVEVLSGSLLNGLEGHSLVQKDDGLYFSYRKIASTGRDIDDLFQKIADCYFPFYGFSENARKTWQEIQNDSGVMVVFWNKEKPVKVLVVSNVLERHLLAKINSAAAYLLFPHYLENRNRVVPDESSDHDKSEHLVIDEHLFRKIQLDLEQVKDFIGKYQHLWSDSEHESFGLKKLMFWDFDSPMFDLSSLEQMFETMNGLSSEKLEYLTEVLSHLEKMYLHHNVDGEYLLLRGKRFYNNFNSRKLAPNIPCDDTQLVSATRSALHSGLHSQIKSTYRGASFGFLAASMLRFQIDPEMNLESFKKMVDSCKETAERTMMQVYGFRFDGESQQWIDHSHPEDYTIIEVRRALGIASLGEQHETSGPSGFSAWSSTR